MERSRRQDILGLAAMVSLTFVAAAIGGAATGSSVAGWYRTLARPSWTPPAWVFGPAWTTLYLCMSVAAWLVWRHRGLARARTALALFVAQLALNAAWSVFFFGMRRPDLALVEIVLLWIAVLSTMIAFFRANRVAGLFFVPYLGWVTFAAALNAAFWWLNRAA